MDEHMEKSGEFAEVNMKRLINAVLNKLGRVCLVSILGAVLVFLVTFFFITPKYESSAMFYVNNNALSVGNTSLSISSGDLTTSRNLVESYIVILNTRETMNAVIDYAGVDRTYTQLKKMVSAESVDETEIFEVIVTSSDPAEAERIANAISYILPKRIDTIIEGTSAKIVDSAVVPSKPSSPSYVTNTLIGFLLGLVLSVGAIVLQEIFDITIRREEDVTMLTKLPILAAVPDMMSNPKGGSYYQTRTDSPKKRKMPQNREAALVGDSVPFAAAEAYKLLRTKIQFSFADDSNCHVIGVSSALAGEGKSTTSANLAYALAQLNKRVLLVDCDLRRPSVATKLNIRQEHGLSAYLTRQATLEQIVLQYQMKNGVAFAVVPAGKIPPNPTELLNSSRMERFRELASNAYDYVILDLPPVEEVSDALVAAKLADGVLLAVRQNYCNRIALADTIRQFDFVKGRILGLLLTCAEDTSAGYGKSYYKRYYGHYRGRQYRQYVRAYEEASRAGAEKADTRK